MMEFVTVVEVKQSQVINFTKTTIIIRHGSIQTMYNSRYTYRGRYVTTMTNHVLPQVISELFTFFNNRKIISNISFRGKKANDDVLYVLLIFYYDWAKIRN